MADMPVLSITLETRGDNLVPLAVLATKIAEFAAVLAALEKEVGGSPVSWGISDLHMGSAVIAARPTATDIGAEYRANLEFDAFKTASAAAEKGEFSLIQWPELRAAVRKLTSGLPDSLPGMRLAANDTSTRISRSTTPEVLSKGTYLGTVTGIVQGMNEHHRAEFTLYDDVFDAGVVCYMADSLVHVDPYDLMRKRVRVKGLITPGRGTTVTQIEDITELPDKGGDYTRTEGVWSGWESTLEDRLEALRAVRRGE